MSLKQGMLVILLVASATCCNAGLLDKLKRSTQRVEESGPMKHVKKEPLFGEDLVLARNSLFTWKMPLLAEDVADKLEQIEPSYEELARKLPAELDPHLLLKYNQDIDKHCDDPKFYDLMLATKAKIVAEHQALTRYIRKCIEKYQKTCNVQMRVVESVNDFKAAHEEGWSQLETIYKKAGSPKRLDGSEDSQDIRQAFEEFVEGQKPEYTHLVHFKDTMKSVCTDIAKLARKLRADSFDKNWSDDNDISVFLRNVDICRQIDLRILSSMFRSYELYFS